LDEVEGVALAGLRDVGLMKLDALISRGSRKDFYDLHFVTQHIPLAELLGLARAKYPYARDFEVMAVESLVLFDNAERDPQTALLIDVPWETVQGYFEAQARSVGRTWCEGT
jgi:hypothetical protein